METLGQAATAAVQQSAPAPGPSMRKALLDQLLQLQRVG